MKQIYLSFIFVLLVSLLQAQTNQQVERSDTANYPHYFEMMQDPNANFFATKKAFQKFYATRGAQKGNGYKVFKRWEHYMESRVSADGTKPAPDAVWNAYQQYLATNPPLSPSGSWTELGPIQLPSNGTGQPNGLGRVNAICFHPTNSSIMWAGAPSGGLWKTVDGGTNWTSNTDNLPTLGVSAILIDSVNPSIMYIGTGDRDGGDAPGMGVMKSTNGGSTWVISNTGMGNVVVGAMVMHPTNSSTLFAATSQGIYRSTNAGSSWVKVSATANFKDIRYKPGSSTVMYASASGQFYRSSNSGTSWSLVSSGLPGSGRLVIGVSPANPDYVYAVVGSSSGFTGCYRSTNSGVSFTNRSTSPNILGYSSTGSDNSSQAYYDLCIAVDPNNINIVYVGGINVWKSTSGGSTWSINAHWVGTGAPSVHADQHVLEFSPLNDNLFLGNDGGFYTTSNGGTTWIDKSSDLAIAQIYKIGQSTASKNVVINGYQDNGTAIYKNGSWITEIGGDGMECIADPSDTNYFYGSLYYGDIRRSANYGLNFSQIADNGVNGINEAGAWVTPFCLHEGNSNTMFVGYNNVWRSTNVKASSSSSVSWTKISSFGSSTLRVIEHSPANQNLLYAARFYNMWRSTNVNGTNPTWTSISLPASCNDLEAHPTNANILYMVGGNSVYISSNQGSSWSDISTNLPNVSINCIVYDTSSNGGLYVGTDAGVFYKDNSMTNWINFSTGMPVAAEVTELEIYYGSNRGLSRIRAATYGRGLWTSDLYSPGNVPPIADFNADDTSPCVGSYVTLTDISSNNPVSRVWTITPSSFSYVNGTSDTSQVPEIQFNTAAAYTVKLVVTNQYGSDSVTKTNYINTTSGKTFAYVQDFETFINGYSNSTTLYEGVLMDDWTLDNTGVFTWIVNSGGTPSSSTGPVVDHTLGSNSGKYIYTESSLPSSIGEVTRLVSPCVLVPSTGIPTLEFYYHMYGAGIISLKVDVFYNGAWTNVWVKNGQQHTSNNAAYSLATINLSSYAGNTIKVRFTSERPANANTYYQSDIAIDDVAFKLAGAPIADFAAVSTSSCAGTPITFIDLSTGSPTAWNWSFTPNTVTFVNGTSSTTQVPNVKFNSPGSYTAKLVVSNANGTDSITKTSYINISQGNTLPYAENFESFTVGSSGNLSNGWVQNSTTSFQWYADNGGTPSNNTGPTIDHTLGNSFGKYMYTEATNSTNGNVAEIISPCIDLGTSSNVFLKFWYHMHGIEMGSLAVEVYYNSAWVTVQTITGQQQASQTDAWLESTVDLSAYSGSTIKVKFKGTRGNGYRSDIAIDDVSITALSAPSNDEPCAATLLTTGNSCNYTTSTNFLATSTTSVGSPACGFYNGHDVWFKTVIPASGNITIQSDSVPGGINNGVLAAYTGSCGALTYVACDDNSGVGNMPMLSLTNLTGGDTLYIRYWDYGGLKQGDFKICTFEPDYFQITPSNHNVSGALGSVTFTITSNTTWTIADNASWLTLTPTFGNGNATITANYSANASASRTATITASPTGLSQAVVTVTQYSSVFADFTFTNQIACANQSVSFTNTSVNNTTNQWFVNGVSAGSSANLNYTFTTAGKYDVKLKISDGNNQDSTSSSIFIVDSPTANAGTDTSLCADGTAFLRGVKSYGNQACQTACDMPTNYCASASSNDNFEYISKVLVNGSENISTNLGVGYEDYTSEIFAILHKDTTYTISVTGTVPGTSAYTEYVDVFVDWNRNGLFDEPGIALGNASFTGDHLFSNVMQVPSNAVLGKTKMRVILKYNAAVVSGCDNSYSYGETEDYMIEIQEIDEVSYAWSGPSSFSSAIRVDSIQNVQTTASGTYTMTVTDGLGCTDTDTKVLTVLPQPVVSFASVPTQCINGNTLSLTHGSPVGGSYSGPGVNANAFDPSVAGIGTHTITYTYTSPSGCSGTATQTITVNAAPTVSSSGLPSTICLGDANTNYTLSGTPSGGSFSGSGVTGNVFNKASITTGVGTYPVIYTYSDTYGCTSADTQWVELLAQPIANAGNDANVNYNNSIQLSGSVTGGTGSYTYSWTPAANLTGANTLTPTTGNMLVSQEYVLNVTDNGNACSDVDSVMITVVGGPLSVNLTASSAIICEGETTQLLATVSGGTGTNTYTWSSTPSGFASGIYNPIVNPTVTTTYQVTVNDGVTSQNVSVTIQVNPKPFVSLSSLPSVCEGSPQMSLMGGVPANGTYSGVGVSNGQFDPVSAGVGTHTVWYSYTAPNGCSDSASSSITVHPKPTVSYTNTLQLCTNGSPQMLSGGLPAGGNYQGFGVSANIFDPALTGIGTFPISYVFVDQNGCVDSAQSNIDVYSAPTVSAGSDQTTSTGSSASLSGSVSGGSGNYTYSWSPSSLLQTSMSLTAITNPLTVSTLFTLTVNDTQSSCSDSDQVLVTVTGGNVVAQVFPPNTSVCEGQSQTLLAIGSGGSGFYTYAWSSSPAGFSSTAQNPVVSPTVTTTYTVTISSGLSSSTAQSVVNVYSLPQVDLGADTSICNGLPITLDAGSGFASYLWSTGASTQTITVDPSQLSSGLYPYSVKVSTGGSCYGSDTIMVGIGTAPYVNLGPDIVMCDDESKIIDAGFGFASYLWSTGATTQYIIVDSSNTGVGTHAIWVEVSNQTSCPARDTLMLLMNPCTGIDNVDIESTIEILPNPNNGQFTVSLENYPNDIYQLEVINASGQLVYVAQILIDQNITNHQLDLSNLAKGMYQLRIQNSDKSTSKRIIIQ